jgi:hypothetical protein
VQRDERDVGPLAQQAVDEIAPTSIEITLVAEPLERVLDACARAQRDLPLERAPALEDRDAAHARALARAQLGTVAGGPDSSGRAPADGRAAGVVPVSVE